MQCLKSVWACVWLPLAVACYLFCFGYNQVVDWWYYGRNRQRVSA